MGKVLNQTAKIAILKKRFKKLNPEVGVDMIDWKGEVGKRETFGESYQDLRHAYPEYKWNKPHPQDQYQKIILHDMRKQAEGYGFTVIRESDRRRLSSVAKHAYHHRPKAKDTLRGVREFVHEYDRKWPKRRATVTRKKRRN